MSVMYLEVKLWDLISSLKLSRVVLQYNDYKVVLGQSFCIISCNTIGMPKGRGEFVLTEESRPSGSRLLVPSAIFLFWKTSFIF